MDEGGDSACWLHLTCPDCGGIHDAGQHCSASEADDVSVARAPTVGSRGLAMGNLNATIVVLEGSGVLQGARIDRDVVFTIVAGSGTLNIQQPGRSAQHEVELRPGTVAIVRAGTTRGIVAGPNGLTWSSAHLRRENVVGP